MRSARKTTPLTAVAAKKDRRRCRSRRSSPCVTAPNTAPVMTPSGTTTRAYSRAQRLGGGRLDAVGPQEHEGREGERPRDGLPGQRVENRPPLHTRGRVT